ncbi:MAG: hypothetical protein ACOZCL_04470 [Bacillota bacterium]
MNKHPNEQELIQYLSGRSNEELEEHISSCDECFERAKALIYLKCNFAELWERADIYEISIASARHAEL